MSQEITTQSIPRTGKISSLDALRNTVRLVVSRPAGAGAFLGLAWGAELRAWMVMLALGFGEQPTFTWKGTFGGILLPAALVGAILGGASAAPQTSRGKRWALLSPLLLVAGPALATENFFSILVTTGIGGGAIWVALIGMLGGYGFSGVGSAWLRRIFGLLAIVFTLAGGIGLTFTGREKAATFSPRNAFSGLLFALLMVFLIAGVSAPFRRRSQ